MITQLPIYVHLVFAMAVIYSVMMFYYASGKNNKIVFLISLVALVQFILSYVGFYEDTYSVPPRLLTVLFPIILIVVFSLFSNSFKNWLNQLSLKRLTWLHAVRIPVELVLFWLFIYGFVPELMTFEGRNFDIVIGLTAPIIALLAFKVNSQNNKRLLWIWNLISIVLLSNILIIAVLSTPTVLQQMAFDQPNIAVLRFPFILLPAIIVPLVLISNIAAFVQLIRK